MGWNEVKTYVVAGDHVCTENCACAFTPETAGKAIHRRCVAFTEETGWRDYGKVLRVVLNESPQPLLRAYAGKPNPDPTHIYQQLRQLAQLYAEQSGRPLAEEWERVAAEWPTLIQFVEETISLEVSR